MTRASVKSVADVGNPSLELIHQKNNLWPRLQHYVDDTLSIMPDVQAASTFLSTLNEIHPSISFTMELEKNGKLPFLGMEIMRNSTRLDTKVYRKPTDTGLLLHYNSHVDMKNKHSLLKTMLNRGFKLSSNWQFFHQECERLKEIFTCLHNPEPLVQNTIRSFVEMKVGGAHAARNKQIKLPLEYPCPSKIRDQQTSYASNLVILAER